MRRGGGGVVCLMQAGQITENGLLKHSGCCVVLPTDWRWEEDGGIGVAARTPALAIMPGELVAALGPRSDQQ